jgi:hypothetical protein
MAVEEKTRLTHLLPLLLLLLLFLLLSPPGRRCASYQL